MNFDFSALNFETIDSNINAYPDMFLNQNGVTFTKKVLEDLGYPAFVLCLLDAKARVFAIRSCKSNEPKGFKFSKPRGEQKGVVTISNRNLLDPLRAVTGEDWIPGKRYRVRGFWVADAKTMCFDLNEGVQEDFRPVTPSNDAEKSLIFREKRESQRAAASRLSEKATSPFSPSLRLWKPWKTASGLRTVPTACAHPFFLSGFLPIQRKCSFLFRGRTVAVMGRGRRVNMTKKSKQHTGGFILKKSPEA